MCCCLLAASTLRLSTVTTRLTTLTQGLVSISRNSQSRCQGTTSARQPTPPSLYSSLSQVINTNLYIEANSANAPTYWLLQKQGNQLLFYLKIKWTFNIMLLTCTLRFFSTVVLSTNTFVTVIKKPPQSHFVVGYSFTLECAVNCVEGITFTWTKPDLTGPVRLI